MGIANFWQSLCRSRQLLIPALVLVSVALVFRFGDLSKKSIWHDETTTLLDITGQEPQELFHSSLKEDGTTNLADLRLRVIDSTAVHPGKILLTMKNRGSPHPPLYFLLAWVPAKIAGNRLIVARGFAVISMLAAIVLAFWTGFEILNSALAAWVLAGLMALSPFFVLYSQEARPYALWILLSFLSWATLHRALRKNDRRSWFFYGASSLLLLQVNFLALLQIPGLFLYVWLGNRPRALRNFWKALTIPILGLGGWILWVSEHWGQIKENVQWVSGQKVSMPHLLSRLQDSIEYLAWNFGVFGDFYNRAEIPFRLLYLLLIAACAVAAWKKTSPALRGLLFGWTVLPAAAFILHDRVYGGLSVTSLRHLTPLFIGLALLVATGVGEMWRSAQPSMRRVAVLTMLFISGTALYSDWKTFGASSSIAKMNYDVSLRSADYVLSKFKNPVLVVDEKEMNALAYRNLFSLALQTKFEADILTSSNDSLERPLRKESVDFVFFNPSKKTIAARQLERQNVNNGFWAEWNFFTPKP